MRRFLIYIFPLSMMWVGCTEPALEESDIGGEEEMTLNITFDGLNGGTRALTAPVSDVYIYSYSGTNRLSKNVRYTKKADESWGPYNTNLTWPRNANQSVNVYGLSEPYNQILLDDMENRAIHILIPTTDAHDIYVGSQLNATSKKSNKKVNMNFTRLISAVQFYAINSLENIQFLINRIEVHNVVRGGRFVYSDVTAGQGTWSLLNDPGTGYFGTFSQDVTVKTVPVNVKARQKKIITDNTFFLIPQKTNGWTTTASAHVATSVADANHEVYVVLYCQAYMKDEQTNQWTTCVYGTPEDGTPGDPNYVAPEFLPIYFPLSASWSRGNAVQAVSIDMAKGFTEDGEEWKPVSGDKITFGDAMIIEPELDTDDNEVEPWDEENGPSFNVEL